MRASLSSVLDTTVDYDRRTQWDPNLYDFRVLEQTPCKRYRRIYYAFRSPPTVADRDFHLCEHFRKDYPEPGMYTLYVKSLPIDDERFPEIPKKIRANLIVIGFVFKARFDTELQREVTDVFFVNCLDIMGSVPKWMQNTAAKSIPKGWFLQFEKECQRYEAEQKLAQDN